MSVGPDFIPREAFNYQTCESHCSCLIPPSFTSRKVQLAHDGEVVVEKRVTCLSQNYKCLQRA